jgi:hypothetical protein
MVARPVRSSGAVGSAEGQSQGEPRTHLPAIFQGWMEACGTHNRPGRSIQFRHPAARRHIRRVRLAVGPDERSHQHRAPDPVPLERHWIPAGQGVRQGLRVHDPRLLRLGVRLPSPEGARHHGKEAADKSGNAHESSGVGARSAGYRSRTGIYGQIVKPGRAVTPSYLVAQATENRPGRARLGDDSLSCPLVAEAPTFRLHPSLA